jgi:hypothetical protein
MKIYRIAEKLKSIGGDIINFPKIKPDTIEFEEGDQFKSFMEGDDFTTEEIQNIDELRALLGNMEGIRVSDKIKDIYRMRYEGNMSVLQISKESGFGTETIENCLHDFFSIAMRKKGRYRL